jgi:hypothetical protein
MFRQIVVQETFETVRQLFEQNKEKQELVIGDLIYNYLDK